MDDARTFSRTELILPSPRERLNDFKLPASVNYVSLRESFISDAPFVKRNNSLYWRKFLDNENFKEILSTNIHHISNAIMENGAINLENLYLFKDNPAITFMSQSFSELFYVFTLKEREMLIPKLPEVCTYLIINCLIATIPKHVKLYNTVKFREYLLDYFSELFTGIRITNSRMNRDWLFHHTIDMPVTVHTGPADALTKNVPKHDPSKGSIKTTYKMTNSPLVSMHIGLTPKSVTSYGVNMSFSHLPERPLTNLPDSLGFHSTKPRNKQVYHESIRHFLKDSSSKSKTFMAEFHSNLSSTRKDINKYKNEFEMSLKWVARSEKETNEKKKKEIEENNC